MGLKVQAAVGETDSLWNQTLSKFLKHINSWDALESFS